MFMLLSTLLKKWCTSLMAFEDLLISGIQTVGGSFCGAALFWYIQCPNRRCCQLSAVRQAIEQPKRFKHG